MTTEKKLCVLFVSFIYVYIYVYIYINSNLSNVLSSVVTILTLRWL